MRWFFITLATIILAVAASAQIPRECSEVRQIKQLPYESREIGTDKAYDKLIAKGDKAIPCLISQITNATIGHDPRCPTINKDTKIGDVAFWVVADLLNVMWTDFLPDDVRTEFKTRGDYAYEDYIVKPGARSDVQAKVRTWYAEHKNKP